MQLINGHITDTISLADRGLNYGDGLFETMAVHPLATNNHVGFRVHCWHAHWQRLSQGLQRLGFFAQANNTHAANAINHHHQALQHSVLADIKRLLAARPQPPHVSDANTPCIIKVIITRGSHGRGYHPPAMPQLNRIVQCLPWPEGRESLAKEGVRVRLCHHRWSAQPAFAGLKHLNRLDQVVARGEWKDEFHEGLMLNQQGHLQSGVMSNVFVQRDHTLYTPMNEHAGIDGIMAQQIGIIAKQLSIALVQQAMPMCLLSKAQSVFLTNSINGIWPVISVDETPYVISPLIRHLQQALSAHVRHHAYEIRYD